MASKAETFRTHSKFRVLRFFATNEKSQFLLLRANLDISAKFETGQTFRPVQTDTTLLAYNCHRCWELLRPFARSLLFNVHESASVFNLKGNKIDTKDSRNRTHDPVKAVHQRQCLP